MSNIEAGFVKRIYAIIISYEEEAVFIEGRQYQSLKWQKKNLILKNCINLHMSFRDKLNQKYFVHLKFFLVL